MSELDPQTIVDRLPGELAARLESLSYFADIPVVVAEKGNVIQELKKRQAAITSKGGKWGVAVIVLPILEEDPFPNLQDGPMNLLPAFQVIENPEQNFSSTGTGKSRRQVARVILRAFKGSLMEGLTKQIKAGKPAVEPVELADQGANMRGVQVNLECIEAVGQPMAQVQLPVVAGVEGQKQVTISCATAGATIMFTTDDSYPLPAGAGTAQVYGGPIEIPAGGLVLRACGYRDGMLPSSVIRKTISVD